MEDWKVCITSLLICPGPKTKYRMQSVRHASNKPTSQLARASCVSIDLIGASNVRGSLQGSFRSSGQWSPCVITLLATERLYFHSMVAYGTAICLQVAATFPSFLLIYTPELTCASESSSGPTSAETFTLTMSLIPPSHPIR